MRLHLFLRFVLTSLVKEVKHEWVYVSMCRRRARRRRFPIILDFSDFIDSGRPA